uniref:Uncharacterized protein n=1 Tax=Avena sativa TaxID=4498 RepID=A0ACD6AEY6_AVESA
MEANMLLGLAAILTLVLISGVLWHLVWRPYTVARCFARQGIRGPPYRFLVGSLLEMKRMLLAERANFTLDTGCHDYTSLISPFFRTWVSDYGKTFLYWLGPIPAICSTDMEMVQQVLGDRSDLFQKDYLNPSLEVIFGKGVGFVNGDDWKRHRKVVYQVFNHENLKSLSSMTLEGTQKMIQQWCIQTEKGERHQAEIDVRLDLEELTIGLIERVVFGKNRYKEAREAFLAGKELQKLAVYAFSDPPVPGFRYLPTRRNRRSWKLEKVMKSKIMKIIEARLAENTVNGDDLLGLMLQACRRDAKVLSTEEIIGECVTIFAAGNETTSNTLTWGMFLLSIYPQWQEKIREEVLREWPDGDEVPSIDILGEQKLLYMFILETLRLYSTLPFLLRKTTSDTMVANIDVPKGTMILFPVGMIHRDKKLWGLDADEFNPMRFEKGILRAANHPQALLAFSHGPRVCAGKSHAMVEMQIVIAMILRKFSFSLSSKYVHMPTNFVSLAPRYGLPLIVKNLSSGPKNVM